AGRLSGSRAGASPAGDSVGQRTTASPVAWASDATSIAAANAKIDVPRAATADVVPPPAREIEPLEHHRAVQPEIDEEVVVDGVTAAGEVDHRAVVGVRDPGERLLEVVRATRAGLVGVVGGCG